MIKAIETQYKGYRFRSRLEARWAVFFDALDLEWEYEREGFDLGEHGWYLPDFYLPGVDGGYWIEVKGDKAAADDKAWGKLMALTEATGTAGLLVYGDPYPAVDAAHRGWEGPGWKMSHPAGGGDFPYYFCVCPWCGKVGIEFDGRGARVCGWQAHHKTEAAALGDIRHLGHWRADDKCYTADDERFFRAAIAARSARFEHGEMPR